jgi:iron complex outermembrane receptor protein
MMSESIKSAVKAALKSASALTTATALLGFATAVSAQEAAPAAAGSSEAETVDEVVVTGFRASLNAALSDKREATGAIDSIRAEDISKFPDSNLAESMQRVPGVSITRDAGEGRNLSVRGLGAQFTRVRINGMEAMSTTGGTDSSGGTNRNRQFDFNVFASELFNSLTARKTASADVDEGSLGATVDLRTARPFDFKEFTMAAGLKGAYNDLQGDIDPRATFLISNVFADGKFGVLFSAAYAERGLIEEGESTVRWDRGNSSGGFNPTSTPTGVTLADVSTAFNPRIPRYGRLTHDQDRLGLTTSLQFQPNESNLFNLDVLYSDFNAKRDENFLEAISFSRTGAQAGKPQTIVREGEIDDHGTLVYGLFDDVDLRSESRHDELETIFYSVALSAEHELSEHWSVDEELGYSRSDFNNPIQTTVTLDRSNSDGYSYDYRDSNRLPSINYNFDTTNPANWSFANLGGGLSSEIRLRPQGVDNTFQTAKVNLKWMPSDSWKFKFGLDYKKYDFVSWEQRRASETTVPVLPAGTTLADLTQLLTGFGGSGLDVPNGTPTSWLIPNLAAFERTFDIYSRTGTFALTDVTNASARGNNRSVEEKDTGAFVQAEFNMDWGIPVRGDVGVRYVKTDMTSQGYSTSGALTTAGNDYSDVLPSLNLVGEITPELLVRFGAAKVMTRPALGSVTPGITNISLVGNLGVSSGNPLLDPIRAKTYDLGVEWYFEQGALLSGAVFYKDIESFTQTIIENKPFVDSGLPLSLLAGTPLTGNEVFQFTQPINTEGGPLKGFEINYQQPLKFLPGKLSNMGVLLNYTWVDSTIKYVASPAIGAPVIENDLVNLSKNAWNATLYYEADGFSIRASAAYRDKYLTAVPPANGAQAVTPPFLPRVQVQDAELTNETLYVDLSASYAINDHLSVSFEALNLTDEFNDQAIDTDADRSVVYTHTGRQLFVGARYKF